MNPAPNEADFTRVLEDWESLSASPTASIDEWTAALQLVAKDEQGLRARGEWVHGRDDLFGVLKIQRNETRHSAMIAWLLDPCAKHRLGTRFLEAFLRGTFPETSLEPLEDAQVRCEVTRGECRADIVIRLPSAAATIVVENKVDAPEC